MTDEFGLRVTLEGDAAIQAEDVVGTLRDLRALLRDVEIALEGREKARWVWAQPDVDVGLVARVNGLDAHALSQIVSVAQAGIDSARNPEPSWPDGFGMAAQARARSILRRLAHLESIVVQGTDLPELVITDATVTDRLVGRRQETLYSSIDGVLQVISHGGRTITASIREHRTNNHVRVRLDADRWLEEVRTLWGRRVIIEGLVTFREDGSPLRMRNVGLIEPRATGRPLREFAGVAPDLTQGQTIGDFMGDLRG